MMLQAGASFCLSSSLAVYVATLRQKSGPQWALLGVLLGISFWTGGVVLAWSTSESARGLQLAISMVFLGSCFVPGLCLYLAARCAQIGIVEEQPTATAAAMLTPGAISYALLLTNPLHGRFLASSGLEVFSGATSDWAGPIFWVHLAMSYSFVATAMWISSSAAYRSEESHERRRLVLLAASSAVPLVANAVYVFRLTPLDFPLTYAGLGISGLLLAVAISRYGFIESFVPARDVIACLRTGIILADPNGRVVSANVAARRLLGRSAAEIRGEPISNVIDRLDPTGAFGRETRALTGCDPLSTTLETREGLVLEVDFGHVRPRKERTIAQFVALDDHTEQRHYERLRQRIERLDAISELVAGLSHEINNPLAFVQANVSHIARSADSIEEELKEVGSEKSGEIHDLWEAAQDSLAGLHRIQEVVSSTKQLLQDPEVRHSTMDLNQVVRDSLALSGLCRKDEISLVTQLHSSPLVVQGSEVQLGQLVLNLLINARDAAKQCSDPTIRVSTRQCGGCKGCAGGVEFRVEDCGTGIASDLHDKVFVPFFTTKRQGDGTGLGLAICAEIVRNHDGIIQISESSLGGACLSVRLPRETGDCPGRCDGAA